MAEVFFDFGLFELIVAVGALSLARIIYKRRLLAFFSIALSVGAPAAIIIFVHAELARWLAGIALMAGLVNGAVLLRVMKHGNVRSLLD